MRGMIYRCLPSHQGKRRQAVRVYAYGAWYGVAPSPPWPLRTAEGKFPTQLCVPTDATQSPGDLSQTWHTPHAKPAEVIDHQATHDKCAA